MRSTYRAPGARRPPAGSSPSGYGAGADVAQRFQRLDEAAFVRVSRWESPLLDRTMPPLTRIAS
jgi:hypothetical protein